MIDINKIRRDFPILNTTIHGRPLVYLDNAATTQKPKVVLDKIIEFYSETNSNTHRGAHTLSERASEEYEKARETVRSFINARRNSEIIFTRGTTESINLVADSLGNAFINPEDEIIITEMEHHSNIVPWQRLCERKGSKLKFIPLNDDGLLDTQSLDHLITDKTKLLSVTYVSNALGTVNDVKGIIDTAHKRDIPVMIDGAQAVQHIPIDVQELDADFFVFSGHKIYAETGIGVLYGKEKLLEVMPPYQSGGGMISSVSMEKTTYAGLPFKFEAGTVNYVAALSLATALDYIHSIGFESIAKHEQDIMNYAMQRIGELDGVTIYGKSINRAGSLSFNLENIHPLDAGTILDKLGIAIRTGAHCAEPLMQRYGISGTIRASFALYNTIKEVDSLIEGINKVQNMLS
jgi:cysteine desulfurase/selenocysteine lyase